MLLHVKFGNKQYNMKKEPEEYKLPEASKKKMS